MNHSPTRIAAVAMMMILAAAPLAAAAADTQPAVDKTDVFARVYDVRDLLVRIPDYPYTGKLGVPADRPEILPSDHDQQNPTTTPAARPPSSREELADELVKLILDTVAPDSWRDNGGNIGAVRLLSGQLIVTQSAENQKSLESLLSQLRETRAQMVRIQAQWLLLSPADANALVTPPSQQGGIPLIDPAALAKIPDSVVRYRADILCFNAQVVSISSGRTHSAITDQQPVVAQNAVAMGPTVRQVQAGVMLEATPTLEAGRDGVVVDVKTRVAEWNEPGRVDVPLSNSTTQPGNRAIAALAPAVGIDRLNMVTQELKTAARLPLGKPALLGGMTLDPTVSQPQNPQLYLILRIDAAR